MGAFAPSSQVVPPAALGVSAATTGKAVKPVTVPAGQTLHFQPGKGYYAAAPTPTPAPAGKGGKGTPPPATDPNTGLPIFTPSQIQTDAANTASGEVSASEQPIFSEQAAADATNLATQKQAAQFNAAGSKLLGSIGPESQAGYNIAAKETGQLAQGLTGPVKASLKDEQAQGDQFAASQGATGQNVPTKIDPTALGNSIYMQNGFIPGSQLAARGAAANEWGQGLKAVNTDTGRAEQQGLVSAGKTADLKFANDIANLAAKYPQLFTAQEHADIAQNATNLRANTGVAHENEVVTHDRVLEGQKQTALKISAENVALHTTIANNQALYEEGMLKNSAASINQRNSYDNARIKQMGQALDLQVRKLRQGNRALLLKAGQIDKSASMATGVITYKDGTQAKDKKGNLIAVDPRVYSSSSATVKATPFQKAVTAAVKAKGTPVYSTTTDQKFGGGKYILDPGLLPSGPQDHKAQQGGVPATTDDPSRAEKGGGSDFATMQSTLMGEYGLTRAKARTALIQAGWTPDGKRPGGKGNGRSLPSDIFQSNFPPAAG